MNFSVLCLVFAVASFELLSAKPLEADDDLVVTLLKPKSKVRGHVLKSYLGNDYYGFQDIPFAVPPVGNLRFQDALPHPGWDGVLNATSNSKVCFQMRGRPRECLVPNDALPQRGWDGALNTTSNSKECYQMSEGQEDCLVLNVYTPVKSGTRKLPVYFWVHGGGFAGGSCTLERCNPAHFMDQDMVVVTTHYRVGPLGFLTTEDGVIPGNIGLKDQLLALKWVNKNIAAFGGDPTKVTIGGQSAGAISISSHVISQKATGLYRSAVIESGTALVHGSYISTARDYAFQVGKIIQPTFNSTNSQDLLKILKSASLQEIGQAANEVKLIANQVGLLPDLTWGIVLEKHDKDPHLTVPFDQALREGKFDKVPLLIGFNSEEILTFVSSVKEVTDMATLYDENSNDLVYDKLNVAKSDIPMVGEQLKKIYTDKTFSQDLGALLELSSDIGLTNPTIRQAALSAKHAPVYLYEFAYEGSIHMNRLNISGADGCAHHEELTYMWPEREVLTPEDQQISLKMVQLWTNFIKVQNPTPNSPDPVLGDFQWPRIRDQDDVEFAMLNKTMSAERSPKRYKAVKALYAKYAKPPYIVF